MNYMDKELYTQYLMFYLDCDDRTFESVELLLSLMDDSNYQEDSKAFEHAKSARSRAKATGDTYYYSMRVNIDNSHMTLKCPVPKNVEDYKKEYLVQTSVEFKHSKTMIERNGSRKQIMAIRDAEVIREYALETGERTYKDIVVNVPKHPNKPGVNLTKDERRAHNLKVAKSKCGSELTHYDRELIYEDDM